MADGEKRSNAEIELIVSQICTMMIKGIIRREQILQYASKMDAMSKKEQDKRNWIPLNVSDRQIDEYIRRAKEMLVEGAKEDRENIRARFLAQLEDLYQRAVQEGKIQTANQIMKTKIYLQGMGGMNVSGSFNINNFDIQLNQDEEAEYKKRIQDMYGDD